MITLNVSWEDFRKQIEEYINEVNQFSVNKMPLSKEEYDEVKSNLENWRKRLTSYLENSVKGVDFWTSLLYDDYNQYSSDFCSYSEDIVPTQLNPSPKLLYWINFLYSGIVQILDLLSVSDILHNKSHLDLEIRNKFASEEILSLVLTKLSLLYNDRFYPIDALLLTNGIKINAERECQEYIDVLRERELVNQYTIVHQKSIRLTLKGKMYVENLKKKSTSDYSSVSNDKDQLFEKLDEILKEVEKNNLGNEILFEEIEELKFAYDKLSKKNWGQLFKGKLVDLVVGQVINEDMAKRIFEEIANMPLYLK